MTLKIKELSKIYKTSHGDRTVLSCLNLELSPGEVFALMGANGCGKTTLLKIISALVLPTSGEVLVTGIDAALSPRGIIARTGLVNDAEGSFYQMLCAEDNLKFFARLHGASEDIIGERIPFLLDKFKIRAYGNEKFAHLSSGIRQRLAFIRALVHEPDVLLIDEAAKSLDEGSLNEISAYIKEECEKNLRICIAVTHDRAWAKKYCTRIGTLVNGKIQF